MPSRDPLLEPRKQPRQGRSRATYQAILEGCTQVLKQGGVAALSTNRLAERAGVSVGSLYQYFPTKEAVLAELVRGLRQDMAQDIEDALAAPGFQQLDMGDKVLRLVQASLLHHRRNPDLALVLERAEEALLMDEEVAEAKRRITAMLQDTLANFGIIETELVARDMVAISSGLAKVAVCDPACDFEALARRIQRALMGYLTL